MKSEHKTKNKTRRKKNATQKNGVPRFFRETPFDLALFNYINLSAVVFSCKIFVKFCSLSKLQVFTVNGELEYGGDFSTVCGELLKYNFAIINRGILVNLDHIQNITKYDIILSNGRKIPIGKTYKDEIVARYLNYATGR